MSFFLLMGGASKQQTASVPLPVFDFSLIGPTLPAGVVLARASPATFVDINGHVAIVPANQPRFEFSGATGVIILPPVVSNNAFSTTASTPLTVAAPGVLANDTDPQGQAITVNSFDAVTAHGTVACNNDGSFTYNPTSSFSGSDSWTYDIKNASGIVSTSRGTVTMTVNAVVPPTTAIAWAGPVAGTTLTGNVTFSFTGANLVNVEVFGPSGRLTSTSGATSATTNVPLTQATFVYNSAVDADGTESYSAHAWNSPAGTPFTSEADAGTRSFVNSNHSVLSGSPTTGNTYDQGPLISAPAIGPAPIFAPPGGKGGGWTPVLNLTFGATTPLVGGAPVIPLPTIANSLNITASPFNASTASGDNTTAINNCLSAALAQGKHVFVPPGAFSHDGLLECVGPVRIWGQWPNSILHATNIVNNAIHVTGAGGGAMGLVMNNNGGGSRLSNPSNAGVYVDGATNFVVQGNEVHGSAATGIFHNNVCGPGVTQYNWITDTLADAIHHTGQAHDITTSWNRVERAGDDGVAAVGYSSDPGPVVNIISDHNTILNSLGGRGLSIVGGSGCKIQNCHVNNSAPTSGGIILATETALGGTRQNSNCTVSGNTIINCGGGHGSIEIDTETATQVGIIVTGNQISQDRSAVIQFNSGVNCSISLTNNTDYGTNTLINNLGNVTFVANTNNVQRSAASYPGDLVSPSGGPSVMTAASGTLADPTITTLASLGNYVVGCNNTGGPPTPNHYNNYGSNAQIPASWNQLDKVIFVPGGSSTPRQNGITAGEQLSLGPNYLRSALAATVTGNVGAGQVNSSRFSPQLVPNPRISGVDFIAETMFRMVGQSGQAFPFIWYAWWFAGQGYDSEWDTVETFGFNNASPKGNANQNSPCELAHCDAPGPSVGSNVAQTLSFTTGSGSWTLNFDFRQWVTMQQIIYANGTWACYWSGTLSDGTTTANKLVAQGTYTSTNPIGLICDNSWFGPSGNARPAAGTEPTTRFPFFYDYQYIRYWFR